MDRLDTECLLLVLAHSILRLLVATREQLVQRCELVEDTQRRLTPEEKLLGLALLERVDHDRCKPCRLDLVDPDSLIELSHRLERRNVVQFFATFLSLHDKGQLTCHHNFIKIGNQESEVAATAQSLGQP